MNKPVLSLSFEQQPSAFRHYVAFAVIAASAQACQLTGSGSDADGGTEMSTARLDGPSPEAPALDASADKASVQTVAPSEGTEGGVSQPGDASDGVEVQADAAPQTGNPQDAAAPPTVELLPDAGRFDAQADVDSAADRCAVSESASCNPVDQCGCTSGLNCDYTPGTASLFSCVEPGEIATQDACDTAGTCQSGNVCARGLCFPTCRFPDDCSPEERCVQLREGEAVVEGVRICERSCDPLDLDSCGSGATCSLLGSQGQPTCVRRSANAAEGESCSVTADCQAGLGCASDNVCRAWCQLQPPGEGDGGATESDSVTCTEGTVCEPVSPNKNLGMCGAECRQAPIEGSSCGRIPTTCGCSDGLTCQALPDGRTECGVPGPHGYMAACVANADCGPELSCFGGLCRPSCEPDVLACPDEGICTSVVATKGEPTYACMGRCDPVNPNRDSERFTPCGEGAYCAPGTANTPFSESYCLKASSRPDDTTNEGAACVWDSDCATGLGCDAGGTCRPWCRDDSECSGGAVCDESKPRFGSDVTDVIGLCRARY